MWYYGSGRVGWVREEQEREKPTAQESEVSWANPQATWGTDLLRRDTTSNALGY